MAGISFDTDWLPRLQSLPSAVLLGVLLDLWNNKDHDGWADFKGNPYLVLSHADLCEYSGLTEGKLKSALLNLKSEGLITATKHLHQTLGRGPTVIKLFFQVDPVAIKNIHVPPLHE